MSCGTDVIKWHPRAKSPAFRRLRQLRGLFSYNTVLSEEMTENLTPVHQGSPETTPHHSILWKWKATALGYVVNQPLSYVSRCWHSALENRFFVQVLLILHFRSPKVTYYHLKQNKNNNSKPCWTSIWTKKEPRNHMEQFHEKYTLKISDCLNTIYTISN